MCWFFVLYTFVSLCKTYEHTFTNHQGRKKKKKLNPAALPLDVESWYISRLIPRQKWY